MNAALALLALSGANQYPVTPKPVPAAYAKGFESINAADARELVTKLAGPDFQGRKPGSPGFDAAAVWAAERFRESGLAPAGDDGTYFQRMVRVTTATDRPTARFEAGGERLAYGKDFVFAATGDVRLRTKLAFVRLRKGETLTKGEKARLKGRIVIVEKEGVADSSGLDDLTRAQDQGVLGAVSVIVPNPDLYDAARSYTRPIGPRETIGRVFALDITPDGTVRLAKAVGADQYGRLQTPDAEVLVEGRAKVEYEVVSANVLAKLPGRTRETVVIGAHLDHLGPEGDRVYWGADDNASGSAATLMVARAFARNGAPPKRTVVFGLWTFEEDGDVGSDFYVRHPKVPLRDTVAYLNMDMVGRDSDGFPFHPRRSYEDRAEDNRDAVYAASARLSSPELHRLGTEANRAVGLNLRDERKDIGDGTDTWPFAQAGIPVLGAFTGEHQDYHRPTDTAEKLNYPKMTRVAQWIYLCGQDLANRRGRVGFSTTGRYLRGLVRAATEITLPLRAEVEIVLKENGRVLDTTRLVGTGHLPQIFTLRYDVARLDGGKRYVVSARTILDGRTTMSSKEMKVLGQGWSSEGFEVMVEPM